MRKLSYIQGHSIIHRLYPSTKFIWLLLGSMLVLFLTESVLLLLIAGGCFFLLLLIHPGIWRIRGFRFAFLTGWMLFILYLLFEKTGRILFNPGVDLLTITTGGLDMGLRFSCRFLSIVFLSYIFILTTQPSDLAYALMKTGIPYRYGFMLVTALRLAPIMEDEGGTIYKAQLVRGIHHDKGYLRKIMLLVQQFMTPLLISALRRADKLVFSMEGRGFGKYKQRTFRSQDSATILDAIISLVLFGFYSGLLILNFGGIL